MGALITFFFFERAIFVIDPSKKRASPLNGSTSLYSQLQSKKECVPLDYSLYTRELNFGQIIWDKTVVLLGMSWVTHLRTRWEQRGKNQKLPPPTHPQKEKIRPIMSAS
jgi:hypothetical protein